MREFRLRPSMTLLKTQLSQCSNEMQPLEFVQRNLVGYVLFFLHLILILAQTHVGSRPVSAQITNNICTNKSRKAQNHTYIGCDRLITERHDFMKHLYFKFADPNSSNQETKISCSSRQTQSQSDFETL